MKPSLWLTLRKHHRMYWPFCPELQIVIHKKKRGFLWQWQACGLSVLGFDCLLTFTCEFTYSYVFMMLISILPFLLAVFTGSWMISPFLKRPEAMCSMAFSNIKQKSAQFLNKIVAFIFVFMENRHLHDPVKGKWCPPWQVDAARHHGRWQPSHLLLKLFVLWGPTTCSTVPGVFA